MNPFGVSTPFHLTDEFLAAAEAFNKGTSDAVRWNRDRTRREHDAAAAAYKRRAGK